MAVEEHDRLAAGHAALADGDWERARDLLQAALAAGATGEAFEGLGWEAWWLDDDTLTFSAREQAYRAACDPAGAGRVAAWIAADFGEFRGEEAVGRGWLERAHRLLDPLPESADRGWLALVDADFAINVDRDLATTAALSRGASALGRRPGVADLEAVGLGLEGLALVCGGAVEEGMRRLDEASAIATAEDMHLPLSSGWALCCVLSACDGIGDFRRAAQWCDAVRRFGERWAAASCSASAAPRTDASSPPTATGGPRRASCSGPSRTSSGHGREWPTRHARECSSRGRCWRSATRIALVRPR
jgi:hypothetical protein